MADVNNQTSSPSRTEPSEEQTSPAVQCTSSTTFCDPSANVIFRTSDNVIYRVHDYYLKAASEFFRDMLDSSTPSSSLTDPIPVDEPSEDFEIMLFIITGRPHAVAGRSPKTWKHAMAIYQLLEKYQLDGHQPWFSELCAKQAVAKPVEALIMACDRLSIDTILTKCAISEGFSKFSANRGGPFDSQYFIQSTAEYDPYTKTHNVKHVLDPNNMTLKFRLRLGFKGTVAYCHTFKGLAQMQSSVIDWNGLANLFLANVRCIEETMVNPVREI